MSTNSYQHKSFFSHSTHGEKRKKHNIEVLVESTVFKQKATPQVGNLMLSPPHCDFGRAPAFNQTNLLNILEDRDHHHVVDFTIVFQTIIVIIKVLIIMILISSSIKE